MKTLAILRHAKSSWDDPSADDFSRPLNHRGWKAAHRMGRELQERGLNFDLVLSSMAARVRETIDGIQKKHDLRAPIIFEPRLYLASEATLLVLVRALAEEAKSSLIIGHNPGLERLIVELTHDDCYGFRKRVAGKFPAGALAVVELPVNRWADVQPGGGEIVELILPKKLD